MKEEEEIFCFIFLEKSPRRNRVKVGLRETLREAFGSKRVFYHVCFFGFCFW